MLTWVISFKNSFDNFENSIYFLWNMIFVKFLRVLYCGFWSCSFSSLNCPRSTPISLPFQFCVLFPPYTHWVLFVLAKYSWMWDTPWRVLNLLRITPLKEPNCLFPSSYQFPVTSQLQGGPVPTSVLHAETWLMFKLFFCILPRLLQIHRWNCSVVSGKCAFYSHLLSLALKILLSLLPWLYLSPGSQEQMQISHLGLTILQSIILCISTSCVALCSLRCAVRSFLSVEDGCT